MTTDNKDNGLSIESNDYAEILLRSVALFWCVHKWTNIRQSR